MYGLRNLHHTDRICIQTYTRHCWLTRGGLASVILISSAFFLLVNTGRRTLFIFLPRSESCLCTSSADLWSLNKPNGCICLTNTNLLLILWLDDFCRHTRQHLFQRVDEHEHSATGKHLWSISYSVAAWPSGLGAGFSRRRWLRCGFESRCGHFRFLCTFFLFSFRFFVHIFSLWLIFLYSHPRNSFLVYVETGVLARSYWLGI